jgi:thiamine transport system permease protein
MARGALPLRIPGWPGALAAGAVAALCLGPVVLLWRTAEGSGALAPADWAALRFTVVQAALSAALSVLFAVPVARALARRRFVGWGVLVTALGVPFLLPVIVAVMALVAVFGQAGMVNAALAAAGLPGVRIYGPWGVALAHVFLNLPLAVRMILHGWQQIPAERFRTAAVLGFGPAEIARHLERPMLRAVLPGAGLAVFLICLTSFAVALVLGGGPSATTVELAIYQAVRFDFDLGRAALLALVQAGLCAAGALLAAGVAAPAGFGAGLDRARMRWDGRDPWTRLLDAAAIGTAAAFLLLPLGAMLLRGLGSVPVLPAEVWAAALRSLLLAPVSAAIATGGALAIGLLALRGGPGGRLGARLGEAAGMLPLVASPLVLGAGLFLAVLPLVDPARIALWVVVVVNGAMALPFALRLILPALRDIAATEARLAAALGMGGWPLLRLVILPRLRRPLGFSAGVAAALAMGDVGVVALFAPAEPTLPLQVLRLMGAFRSDEAAAAAVVLAALAFGLYALCDGWGRRGHAGT